MSAPAETTAPRTPREYKQLADLDTAEGNAAWNDGNYRRATALWMSAARWHQFARAARDGATR